MEYQILLLPRKDYWEWVRAAKDYVLEYGPNMTQDPGTAARYMRPAQVVTFPLVKKGFPEIGDPEEWFYSNHAGIRIDPVPARTPDKFAHELARRIKDKDRYGQKRKPFYLEWPTDYSVITQPFGANPQIYTRFGMPGHEGLDIRALNNTNIYCCAPGVVYRVNLVSSAHAYGIHVRIRHADGYKTVYGHLAGVLVEVGEHVEAGQLLGYADTTGASTGAHLHLTLKRDGATKRKETIYPKDVIDPTPFMVWPQRGLRKSLPPAMWPPQKCLIGAHARPRGRLLAPDIEQIHAARLEALKINLDESTETIKRLREWNPSLVIMTRVNADFSREPIDAVAFCDKVENEVGRHYRAGVQHFELHTNPNLQVEGWQRSWSGGAEFAQWLLVVAGRLRERYPEIRLGFPGLSPGATISGWRADAETFLHEAELAVHELDWCGVNCYWTDVFSMQAIDGGRAYVWYRSRFPDKLLMITEFFNASPSASQREKAEQALSYFNTLRSAPGVGAAFSFAISSDMGYGSVVWRREGQETSPWPEILGGREF